METPTTNPDTLTAADTARILAAHDRKRADRAREYQLDEMMRRTRRAAAAR